jgi:CENP-B N-terminal DNA-binding domain
VTEIAEYEPEELNSCNEHGIPRRMIPWVCRELALGETSRADLARRFNVHRSTITEFAKRHAARIDQLKGQLDDEFAGIWIADKALRIAAYAADHDASEAHPRWDHFEQIRTRNQIRQAVAEELGQLPARMSVTVVPVTHIIQGVDLSALQ